MKYRDLGRTGLEVPPICLGAMNFGGPSDERDAQIVINLCRESGINFPDTANVYTGEKSEEIVGRGVHADRHRWVIATKVNAVTGDGPNERGLAVMQISNGAATVLQPAPHSFAGG